MAAEVEIHHEVRDGANGDWQLCFQQVTYHYDASKLEAGYRFIWRSPEGHLQADRGQACIPDRATLDRLMNASTAAGWF